MKNVTITLDEKVAQWARVWAARQGQSISKLVSSLLKQKMDQEEGYSAAMRRDLAREPQPLKESGAYPSREDLHERDRLR